MISIGIPSLHDIIPSQTALGVIYSQTRACGGEHKKGAGGEQMAEFGHSLQLHL